MRKLLAFMTFVLFVSSVFAAEFAPVFDVKLLGGQYAFKGSNADMGGNVSLNFIPSAKFSDKLSLIPIYSLDYKSVKSATELVGGDTLITQSLSHTLSLKPIITINKNLALKFKAGYAIQQLKESKDETLTNGAFNYNKTSVGVDLTGKSYSVGYSLFDVKFPNYKSIAETKYGAELQGKIGENILDFTAYDVYAYKKVMMGPVILDTTVDYTIKQFTDQKLTIRPVNTTDVNYSKDKRSDTSILVNLMPSLAIIPTGPTTMFAGLSITYITNTSNQNHTDVQDPNNIQFLPSYYNYTSYKVGPVLNMAFNTVPLKAAVSFEYGNKQYTDRLAQKVQDPANASIWLYSTEKVSIDTSYISLTLSYPVMDGLEILLAPSYYTSTSNMKNETSYAYNYYTSNYYLGITYSYK